jgi:peptide/nickel transport system substrate-binding protein
MTSKKMRNVVLAFASASLLGSLLMGIPAAKAATGNNCKVDTPTATAQCDAITIAAVGKITSLDPSNSLRTSNQNYITKLLIQGMLWRIASDGKPKKDLISDAKQSSDGLTWTLTLKDIKYSDGKTQVVADDAVFMFELLKKAPVPQLAALEDVTAPDAKTIVIKTKTRFNDLPFALAGIYFFMNPRALASDPKYWEAPISAGPYRIKEWKLGDDKITIEANPNYWAKPAVKQVTYVAIPDPVTRVIAIRQGTIDYAFDLPAAIARGQLADRKVFRWQPTQLQGTFTLDFNLREMDNCKDMVVSAASCLTAKTQPWHNPKVRQALSMAVNRKAMADIAFFGDVKPSCAITWPGHFAYKCQNPDRTKQNLAGAKKLLAEAGYPDGFPINITVFNRPGWADAIAVIAAEWRKLGSKMVVTTEPQTDAVGGARQTSGEYQVQFSGATGALPAQILNIYWGKAGAWQNWSGSSSNSADLQALDAAVTEKEQIALIAGIEKKLWDESAHIPLGQRAVFGASRLPANTFSNVKDNDHYFVKQTPPLS